MFSHIETNNSHENNDDDGDNKNKKWGFPGPPKHFCHKHMFVLGAWRFMLIYAWLYAAEPAWGAAASPSKSQAAPGVDAKACQASLEKQEHKAE